MGISRVDRLWDQTQSLSSRHRYHGVVDDRQSDQTELVGVHGLYGQPPASSLSSFLEIPQARYSSAAQSTPVDEDDRLLECAGNRETPAVTRAENVDPISRTQKRDWIDGVHLCARAGAFILLINLVFIAIAAGLASRHPENGSFSDSAVVFEGSCDVSKRWDIALHLIINVLSTCILAASNYCMQTLISPSREEVDAHHARNKWLDIGTASVKNLSAIGSGRLALWVILMITATPFHLMYNSIIFGSSSTTQYGAVVGPKDLNPSNIWNLTTPGLEKCFMASTNDLSWDEFASEITDGNYRRISTQQCIQTSKTTQSRIKGIIALADNLTISNGGNASILQTAIRNDGYTAGINMFHGSFLQATQFFNESAGLRSTNACQNTSTVQHHLLFNPYEDSNMGRTGYGVNGYNITGCLTIKAPEHCQLLYSPAISMGIMLAGGAKVAAMFLAARISRGRLPPLLTIGDAIASFLTNPDPTTEGLCWLTAADIQKGQWKPANRTGRSIMTPPNSLGEAITYKRLSKRKFWMRAASGWRWAVTLFMCLSCIIVGTCLFEIYTMYGIDQFTSDVKQWFSSDIDTSSYGFIGLQNNASWTMLSAVVVANTPQLLITISYYCYNGVLTSILAAAEYSSYGVKRKPLRVTWPIKGSQQRSTYWLSVPYQYNAPILVLYMVLHWLVSQSIFYLVLVPYDMHDERNNLSTVSSLSYSSTPILLSVLVGALMMLILFTLAFRKFDSVIPLASSSSAAISAACHPPKDENLDTAALGLVKWGQTISPAPWAMVRFQGLNDQEEHCSFTSLDTVSPTTMKLYA
ncbi:hypothetical protein N7447_008794 [Penicillium robsamsonii]|uniref:uncharacterized protein n=1 Tax=Penicillium robsamsonii TaxID=1792511 RepID=UPI0025490A18|nr:uncharacterized protein N7447_008794 [Penicillium robsamsonii]KAJ5816561.1 hypothetical protein N7447_008794 [Penicillium robsamsonii]